MTALYGTQMTLVNAGTTTDPALVDGTVRAFVETVTYATQTTSDTIAVARLPKGAVPLGFELTTSVSTSTATIALGITGSTAKYKAAAAFTTTDTPTRFGKAAALGTALTAEEEVIITIGTASLPASGTLRVVTYYAFD